MATSKPDFSHLDDNAFLAQLSGVLASERASLVESLWHLVEFEDRKLQLTGYSSAFDYCSRKLRLSNGCCHRRTHGAALLRRFPLIADYLADGRVSLTKLILVEKLFTEDNLVPLLEKLASSTEREVEKLLVTAIPRQVVPDSIRKIPARGSPIEPLVSASDDRKAPAPIDAGAPSPDAGKSHASEQRRVDVTAGLFGLAPPTPPQKRDTVRPINAAQTAISFTVHDEFLKHLEHAKSLLSHRFPEGRLEDVLGECLQIALPVLLKKRIGAGSERKRAESRNRSETAATVGSPAKATSRARDDRATSGTEVKLTPLADAHATRPASGIEVNPTPLADARPPRPTSGTEVKLTPLAAVHPPRPTSGTEVNRVPPPHAHPTTSIPRSELESPIHDQNVSRYVPKAIAEAVWLRDGGCCTFRGPDGTRCGSTFMIELDHIWPRSLGGPSTTDNVRLLCRVHNQLWADLFFGGNCWDSGPWELLPATA